MSRISQSAVQSARLGRDERLAALKRLDEQARQLERHAAGSSFDALMENERKSSSGYGGRSVFGWEAPERGADLEAGRRSA